MTERTEAAKTIYYLESISRNLKEFSEVTSDMLGFPSIGGEVLADNRDWLDNHIAKLRSEQNASV